MLIHQHRIMYHLATWTRLSNNYVNILYYEHNIHQLIGRLSSISPAIKLKWYRRGEGFFYQIPTFPIPCFSQGSAFTGLCNASSTVLSHSVLRTKLDVHRMYAQDLSYIWPECEYKNHCLYYINFIIRILSLQIRLLSTLSPSSSGIHQPHTQSTGGNASL
jgi:hypothetical protein